MAAGANNLKMKATNFTEAEKLALTEAIREKHDILYGKLTPQITKRVKQVAWEYVLESVNAVSSVKRSLSQIQDKYKNMKKNVKATAAQNSTEIKKTGGGPALIKVFNECEDNILATLPTAAICGITGGIDTSDLTGLDTENKRATSHIFNDTSFPKKCEITNPITAQACDTEYSTVILTEPIAPNTSVFVNVIETPNQSKCTKRARDLRSSTEILMEKQVNLVEEQVQVMRSILKALERRNEIEEEKLALKKSKYSID